MINKRNKGISYHYSLSPQKPKKVTGSRLIILRNPVNKLFSPQPLQSDLFLEQSSLRGQNSEKSKPKQGIISTYKISMDPKQGFNSILDINKFIFPSVMSPVLSVISIKEAMRDKEWAIKAKECISKELSELINNSNGVVTESPSIGYKYHLGKGNNIALIKQCLNSRWWWTEDSSKHANLIWVQGKSSAFFLNNTSPIEKSTHISHENAENSVKCHVKFESDTLEEKQVDISSLSYDLITKSKSYISFIDKFRINPLQLKTHNKLEFNSKIADKKELLNSLKNYYAAIGENVFDYMPTTYHIKQGEDDPEFVRFGAKYFKEESKKSIWIIKPGENTNRGNGIVICDSLDQIKSKLKSNPFPETGEHTYIIQKYIEKPFLVNKRKFDIRLYALVTSVNGTLQCYFYQEGYIRTSSKDYNSKTLDNKFIHLTNDAVQNKAEDYGKYENGNKMSYKDFQKYLDNKKTGKNFFNDVLPTMKKMVNDTIKASFMVLDKNKRLHTFEIFGYDFLLDCDLRPWLLEVNSNPCLELSSTILARIIPAMIENAFKIAIDPVFPEPPHSPKRTQVSLFQDFVAENKFELIFHSEIEGKEVLELMKAKGSLGTFLGNDET